MSFMIGEEPTYTRTAVPLSSPPLSYPSPSTPLQSLPTSLKEPFGINHVPVEWLLLKYWFWLWNTSLYPLHVFWNMRSSVTIFKTWPYFSTPLALPVIFFTLIHKQTFGRVKPTTDFWKETCCNFVKLWLLKDRARRHETSFPSCLTSSPRRARPNLPPSRYRVFQTSLNFPSIEKFPLLQP